MRWETLISSEGRSSGHSCYVLTCSPSRSSMPTISLRTRWVGQQDHPGEDIEVSRDAYFQDKTQETPSASPLGFHGAGLE